MSGRTAIALEGGGMRGTYTAGVLDELMDQGIYFDGLAGVSAGIIHGISFVSRQYARNIRYFVKYRKDSRFMSLKSWRQTGDICDVDFCYHEIPEELYPMDYDKFKENAEKMDVYAVATNLETGKADYLLVKDLRTDVDAVRASASLPIVSNIVEYRGKKLLDGGTADSIPTSFLLEQGFDKVVTVLTRPEGYEKGKDRSMPLLRMKYKKYPDYISACQNRHLVYNKELELLTEQEKAGQTFVIRPSRDLEVSRSEKDIEKIKRIYKLGRFDMRNAMPNLLNFLAND